MFKNQMLAKVLLTLGALLFIFVVFLEYLFYPFASHGLLAVFLVGLLSNGIIGKEEISALVGNVDVRKQTEFQQVNMIVLLLGLLICGYWIASGGASPLHSTIYAGDAFLGPLQVKRLNSAEDFWVWIGWIIDICVFSPIVEETVFCVILAGALFKVANRWIVIAGVSLLFIMIHNFWNPHTVDQFLFSFARIGVSLFIFSEIRNARPGIWMHILGNIFAVGHLVGV